MQTEKTLPSHDLYGCINCVVTRLLDLMLIVNDSHRWLWEFSWSGQVPLITLGIHLTINHVYVNPFKSTCYQKNKINKCKPCPEGLRTNGNSTLPSLDEIATCRLVKYQTRLWFATAPVKIWWQTKLKCQWKWKWNVKGRLVSVNTRGIWLKMMLDKT